MSYDFSLDLILHSFWSGVFFKFVKLFLTPFSVVKYLSFKDIIYLKHISECNFDGHQLVFRMVT